MRIFELNCNIRDNDELRGSFNALTHEVFCFGFEDWYNSGGWGDMYIPHAVVENGEVIANVSVNIMPFSVGGERKNYIQLGTVMTRPDRRGEGLGRVAMEFALEKYLGAPGIDGIYLFGNDSVLDFYPKFGFVKAREFEYSAAALPAQPYALEKTDLSDEERSARFFGLLAADNGTGSAFAMVENIGLYKFWLMAEYGDSLYFIPETGGYVIAEKDGGTLFLRQSIGFSPDPHRLAAAFGAAEVKFCYTPADRSGLVCTEHKEEDCTLFIIGDDLARMERDRLMFPVISHA